MKHFVHSHGKGIDVEVPLDDFLELLAKGLREYVMIVFFGE
jgi:hypothetical protein